MKKNKISTKPKISVTGTRLKQKFPPGWSERRVRAVIRHYEHQADEERAREIESAPEVTDESLISVPTELLPAIRKVILQHQKSA